MATRERAKATPATCQSCGEPVLVRGRLGTRFCSDACRWAWHRKRRERAFALLEAIEGREAKDQKPDAETIRARLERWKESSR
jgi:predicted nucleic acid-binding Zn ribbon protein